MCRKVTVNEISFIEFYILLNTCYADDRKYLERKLQDILGEEDSSDVDTVNLGRGRRQRKSKVFFTADDDDDVSAVCCSLIVTYVS